MKVSVKLDVDKVVFDKNGAVNLMASLVAPDVSKDAKRNPLCICAVIDRSGSMRERAGNSAGSGNKMDYVKKSLWKMIDHMTDDDSLALVFFDDIIETVDFKVMTSTNKEIMKQEVLKIEPRGNTDIGSAVIAAGKLFDKYEGGAKAIERIMLLTDGEANIGAVHPEQFGSIISGVRKGVTVSSFGYGARFNEDLLTSISKQGKGNNYYIETPDNVSKVFAVELGGLLTCFAQDIVLSIKTHKGASVTNVLNDVDVSTKKDGNEEMITDIKVGDIYAGERRDILIRMEFEKRPQALPRPVTLADVVVTYRSMEDAKSKETTSKVKVNLVKTAAEATQVPDSEIAEQVAILEAANSMAKAKKMADAGQWAEAKWVISQSADFLRSRGTEKAAKFADGMDNFELGLNSSYVAGGNLSKSMGSYSYAASSSRSLHSVGNVSDSLGGGVRLNSVMTSMVEDFANDNPQTTVHKPTTGGDGDDDVKSDPTSVLSGGYTKNRSIV